MKNTFITPLLKFQQGALPIKIRTIKNFTEEPSGPHSHDYYELIWVTKGKGAVEVNMRTYATDRNTAFCLRPHELHQLHMQSGSEGFVFSFTNSFFDMDEYTFFRVSHLNFTPIFSEERTVKIPDDFESDMKEIVAKMIKEIEDEHEYKMELLRRYFKIFLIHLTRRIDESKQLVEQSREKDLVKSFLELLDKHFKEKKMVAEYARQLLVDTNHLNRVVKRNTGFSASHHIKQRLVLEAKRMCRYSTSGLKEIAYNLGFFDSAHFSRFFKSLAGVNFSEFKRGVMTAPLYAQSNLRSRF